MEYKCQKLILQRHQKILECQNSKRAVQKNDHVKGSGTMGEYKAKDPDAYASYVKFRKKMGKFVTLDKMSKKQKREFYSMRRGTWGELSPVTKKVKNGKQTAKRQIQTC